MQTLQHIPVWVFVLLTGLIGLGLLQTRTRQVSKKRLLSINITLSVLSLVGVIQQWRHTAWLAIGLLSWATSCALVVWALGRGNAPAGARYDAVTHWFTVPGSWLPLALFMAIFACKFQVGIINATAPEQLSSVQAAIGISALYGLFSGLFNAKALRLLKLATLFTALSASASQAQIAPVGLRQIQVGGMPVTLVYPTAEAAQPLIQGAFTLLVANNAAPLAATSGKRALIVLSHGTAGSAQPDHALAATLARAGFVVAQPEHRGDNWQDFSRAGPESWKTRPQDVSDAIDAVAQDPMLAPLVNTHRVGVHGMSAGGVTGLALAGAQWRMLNLIQHCAEHLDEDIGFCLNGLGQQPMQQKLRQSQFALGRVLTETNAPISLKALHGGRDASRNLDPRPDTRIAAVSLVVPVGVIFTANSLSRITIPVGLTTAGNDGVLLPRFHSQHVLKHCTSCTLLSDQPEAGHFDWLSPWPSNVAQTVAATQMRGGLPNLAFGDAARQKAFDQIALFFKQKL